MDEIILVPLEKIVTNHFQQEEFVDQEKVVEIADSLLHYKDNGTKGLLQVPVARQVNGTYEMAFGRHRLYAFRTLVDQKNKFFSEMPLIIKSLTDQEMFELMAIENLQRRNISFIEEGQVFQAYMTTFNKTSVETAKRFQKSEEYVRSRLMLVQLPEEAKAKAMSGDYNVSIARDLVTVNKLLGAEGVKNAMAELEEEDLLNSEDAIGYVLSESKDVAQLDEKAGWFSAKPFPTKHMDQLTYHVVAQAMYPIDYKDKELKSEVDQLLGYLLSGMHFADEAFPRLLALNPQNLEKARVLANPPQCSGCDFHAVFHGEHYCSVVQCRARKVAAWDRQKKEEAAKKIGIPMYTKDDGKWVQLYPYEDADKKLFKSKSPDLRLAPASYLYTNFDGLGPDMKLVAVGETAKKRLDTEQEAQSESSLQSLRRLMDMQRRNLKEQFLRRFQWEVAASVFASALDGITNPSLLAFMLEDVVDIFMSDVEMPQDTDDIYELFAQAKKLKKPADALREYRRIYMHVQLWRNYDQGRDEQKLLDSKKTILEFAKWAQTVAGEWGVKVGKGWLVQAEKYQADLDQAIKDLKAPTKVAKE